MDPSSALKASNLCQKDTGLRLRKSGATPWPLLIMVSCFTCRVPLRPTFLQHTLAYNQQGCFQLQPRSGNLLLTPTLKTSWARETEKQPPFQSRGLTVQTSFFKKIKLNPFKAEFWKASFPRIPQPALSVVTLTPKQQPRKGNFHKFWLWRSSNFYSENVLLERASVKRWAWNRLWPVWANWALGIAQLSSCLSQLRYFSSDNSS